MVYAVVLSGDVCSLCIGGFSHYEVRYEAAEEEYIKVFSERGKVWLVLPILRCGCGSEIDWRLKDLVQFEN